MAQENKKKIFYFIILIFFLASLIKIPINSAIEENQKNVYFFWGKGCSHCENVIRSGVLEKIEKKENISIKRFEVYYNQTNREVYKKFAEQLGINEYQRGIPFLVIECEEKISYFIGDSPIINNLENAIDNCTESNMTSLKRSSSDDLGLKKLTLKSIIIAAIIDSVNPCAFGVLIFLLGAMLSTSSLRRAVKYGLIYVLIVFLVYLSFGIGIINLFHSLSNVMNIVITITSLLILIGGIIEIKDFFFYGKGISLKIPSSVKPTLEKIIKKGTLPAVILVGIIVALVELPCTGGIYLAILSLMHLNKTFGLSYLIIYNIIFVLPLLFIIFLVYYGTKTDKITYWLEDKKRWMRLLSGILMIILSIYLINSVFKLI